MQTDCYRGSRRTAGLQPVSKKDMPGHIVLGAAGGVLDEGVAASTVVLGERSWLAADQPLSSKRTCQITWCWGLLVGCWIKVLQKHCRRELWVARYGRREFLMPGASGRTYEKHLAKWLAPSVQCIGCIMSSFPFLPPGLGGLTYRLTIYPNPLAGRDGLPNLLPLVHASYAVSLPSGLGGLTYWLTTPQKHIAHTSSCPPCPPFPLLLQVGAASPTG